MKNCKCGGQFDKIEYGHCEERYVCNKCGSFLGEEKDKNICPECGSNKLTKDLFTGDVVCDNCSLLVKEKEIFTKENSGSKEEMQHVQLVLKQKKAYEERKNWIHKAEISTNLGEILTKLAVDQDNPLLKKVYRKCDDFIIEFKKSFNGVLEEITILSIIRYHLYEEMSKHVFDYRLLHQEEIFNNSKDEKILKSKLNEMRSNLETENIFFVMNSISKLKDYAIAKGIWNKVITRGFWLENNCLVYSELSDSSISYFHPEFLDSFISYFYEGYNEQVTIDTVLDTIDSSYRKAYENEDDFLRLASKDKAYRLIEIRNKTKYLAVNFVEFLTDRDIINKSKREGFVCACFYYLVNKNDNLKISREKIRKFFSISSGRLTENMRLIRNYKDYANLLLEDIENAYSMFK